MEDWKFIFRDIELLQELKTNALRRGRYDLAAMFRNMQKSAHREINTTLTEELLKRIETEFYAEEKENLL